MGRRCFSDSASTDLLFPLVASSLKKRVSVRSTQAAVSVFAPTPTFDTRPSDGFAGALFVLLWAGEREKGGKEREKVFERERSGLMIN